MLNSGSRPAACQVDPAVSSARSSSTDVRPALQSQVIERADAYHTAADHHDAGMSFHRGSPERKCVTQCNQRPAKQDANCDNPLWKCARPAGHPPATAAVSAGTSVWKTTRICREQTISRRRWHNAPQPGFACLSAGGFLGIARRAAQVQVRISDLAELFADRGGQCARAAAHGESLGRQGSLRMVRHQHGWARGRCEQRTQPLADRRSRQVGSRSTSCSSAAASMSARRCRRRCSPRLRRLADRRVPLGALCTGGYALARAGLARQLQRHHPLGESLGAARGISPRAASATNCSPSTATASPAPAARRRWI